MSTVHAQTKRLPLEPEAPADRLIRAAVSWVNDQTCGFAHAELEEAVEAYQGRPLGADESIEPAARAALQKEEEGRG